MDYPYTRTNGTVSYVGPDGLERGREWFSLHRHTDGRFIHAICEMEEGGLLRDTSWSLDHNWRPVEGYVRVALNGCVTGSTHYSFSGASVTCNAVTPTHGSITQTKRSDQDYEFLGLHPLIGDGLIAAVRGRGNPNQEQLINSITCSYSQNGETELLALPIEIGVTYCGGGPLTVQAGEFEAHKYHVRWRREWPPAVYWVWGEDYIFLKSTWKVSELTCELTSLNVEAKNV